MIVTPTDRAQAMLHQRDRRTLELYGERAAVGLGRSVRVDVLKSVRHGLPPGPAIRHGIRLFTPIIRDAMVAAHLSGRLRTVRASAGAMSATRKAAAAYDDAVRYMRKRLDLSPDDVAKLEKLYGDTAVKVTRGLGDALEAKAQEAAADIVKQGMHVQDAMQRMREAFDAAGATPQKPFLLETLVRTQIQTAYGAGRWNADQDPAVQEILWGYTYVTAGDDRVREEHAAMEGTCLPKDDPFWQVNWPPNGFNCRCSTVEEFREEKIVQPPESVEVDGRIIKPGADEGWGYNPGMVYRDALAA